MIEQTDLIRNADNWHLERYSVPSGDLLLSSFVRLRILSSETLGPISPNQSVLQLRQSEMLLKVLNAEITRWEKSWIPLFESGIVPFPCFTGFANGALRQHWPMSTISSQVLWPSCQAIAEFIAITRIFTLFQ